MKKIYIKKILLKNLLLIALFYAISFKGFGQVAVTVTGNTNTTPSLSTSYASLASAITALNTVTTISGPVTLTCATSGAETAPAGGYSISFTGAATATNNVVIEGSSSTIRANGSPTAGSLNDAVFKIIGSDFVTIKSFNILENANSTTAAASNNMTEWGIALLYASPTNGAQNCTIQGCSIDMNRTYQNSFGIYSNSTHTATAATTSATANSATGANSGLTIIGNTITDVNIGICVIGPTAAANHNDGLTIGGSLANANTLTNYGTTGSFSGYANVSGTVNGILIRNTKNFNISFNSITSSNGGVTAGTVRGIFVMAFSNAPTGTIVNTINSNNISVRSGVANGTLQGITVEGTTGNLTTSLAINSNNFSTFGHTLAASGTITFISNSMANLTTTISSNTFTNISVNTSGAVVFIGHTYTIPSTGSLVLDNNSIVTGFTRTSAGTTTITTSNATSETGSINNYTNNNFSNITLTGASTIIGFNNTDGGAGSTKTITGNTFNNWSGTTSSINCMFFTYWNGVSSLSNNTITNISGQSTITGIAIGSAANNATSIAVSGNSINNLSSTGTGGNVIGISSNNSSPLINIHSNTIHTLSSTSTTAIITGISIGGGGTTTNIFSNKIYNLSGNQTGTTVNGINITAGSLYNIYNNVIGDLKATAATGTNSIIGLNATATATYNVYYNTIYLNATSSSATTFGSSCINFSSSATSFNLRNNVLVNLSVPGSNGSNVATNGISACLRRSAGTAATVPANYATSSNNNLFWCDPTAGTNNRATYVEGTTSITNSMNSFTSMRSFMVNRDQLSKTGNPIFASLTGSNSAFLNFDLTIPTPAEGGAVGINTFEDDYSGNASRVPASYPKAGQANGGGTAPDIGAYEFDGTPAVACVGPSSQASSLLLTAASTTVSVSYTAATPSVTGYLIVAALSGNTPSAPVDGISYTIGSTALGANTIIVGNTSSVSFTATGLTASTNYDFYVYTFNDGACAGGPVFYTTTPLTGSVSTLCTAPVATAGTSISPISFAANWGATAGATDYILDVSTSNTFNSFVTGYNALATGNILTTSVTGINHNTTYYFRVKATTGCPSGYSNTITVSIPHLAGKAIQESFPTANGTTLPTGWANTGFTVGSTRGAVGNGANAIYMNLYSSATTGTFNTSNIGPLDANANLTFQYKTTNYSSPFATTASGWGNFQVQVSTDYGTSWTNLGSAYTAASGTYSNINLSLAAYAGQYVKVRFNATWLAGDYDLSFDSISVIAPCTAPSSQATSLTFSGIGPGQFTGSFVTASGNPTGYLVVRLPNGTLPTSPTNGVSYTAGNALGLGTVVSYGSSTSFLASGLSPLSSYDIYVYSYNNSSCLTGPVYNTSSPLVAVGTTSACSAMSTNILVDPSALPSPGAVYNTLGQAMLELNGCGITGPTTVVLAAGYTSVGENFPIVIRNITGTSATNTITIMPHSSVSSDLVIGGTIANEAIFDFQGASYVRIDGRPGGTGSFGSSNRKLVIQNAAISTTPSSTASCVRLMNGANNNIIQGCKINGASGIGTSSGLIMFSTGTSAGNSNNTITHNTLNGNFDASTIASNGIYSAGNLGFENALNTISNNDIGTTLCGVNIQSGSTAWTLSNNSIYSSNINFGSGTGTVFGMLIDAAGTGSGYTVSNNFIGTNAPLAAGSLATFTSTGALYFEGIRIQTASSTASTITGNIIRGIGLSTSPAASGQAFCGIRVFGGNVNCGGNTDALGNIIGDTTTNGSIVINTSTGTNAYTANGIRFFGIGTILQKNVVAGISITSGTGSPTFQAILDAGASASMRNVASNLIGSETVSNSIQILAASTANSPIIQGITSINALGSTITYNRIRNVSNLSTTSSGSFAGISNTSAGTGGVIITFNTIKDINSASNSNSTTTSYVGIISTTTTGTNILSNNIISHISNLGTGSNATVVGLSSSSGANTIHSNTISNLSTSSSSTGTAGSASIIGLSMSSSTAGTTVSNNTIFGLQNNGAAASNVSAIYFSGASTGSNNVFNNFIHSLSESTAGGTLHGIDLADAGNAVIYNNMIRLGIDANGNSVTSNLAINGINQSNSTSNHGIYFNSIYIGGSGVIAGANNTFGIATLATGGTRFIRTNILSNVRANGVGTGKHYCIRVSSNITGLSLDNNDLWTGASFLALNNASDLSSLAAWQTATGKDLGSVSVNPGFVSPTGGSPDLHIIGGVSSALESGATNVSGITTDIDGHARPGPAGSSNGGGLIADIGADEFDGIPGFTCGTLIAGNASVASTNVCGGSLTTITLSGSTLAGTGISYQWESATTAGGTYTPIVGATGSSYAFTPTVASNLFYRCVATCANSPLVNNSTSGNVNLIVDLCNYSVTRSTGITYNSIMSTGNTYSSITDADDGLTNVVSLTGTTFKYRGSAVTGFYATTNGWMSFSTSNLQTTFGNDLTSATQTNVLAPFWEDLVLRGNLIGNKDVSMRYSIVGTLGSGTADIIIEWAEMERFNYADPNINFQVVLHEADNSIDYNYGTFQMFNGATNTTASNYGYFTYSVGMNGASPTTASFDGRIVLQLENTNFWGFTGVTGLKSSVVCNSRFRFVPSATFAGGSSVVAGAVPANNEVAGAITLAVNSSPCTSNCGNIYSSGYATGSSGITTCSAGAPGNADDDVFFSFTTTSGSLYRIAVDPSTNYDAVIQILDATLTPVACVNAAGAGLSELITSQTLSASTLYYLRIYDAATGNPSLTSGNGEFAVCVSEVMAPPVNDDPSGAVSLSVSQNCTITNSVLPNVLAATGTSGVTVCAATTPGIADDDVWYSFTTNAVSGVNYTITVNGVSTYNPVLQVYSGTPSSLTSISCLNASGNGGTETFSSNTLLASTVYYFRIYHSGSGAANGNFNICVTAENTWTGAVSSDWNDMNNWSDANIPNSTATVVIPVTSSDPVLSGPATCGRLTITTGEILSLNGNNLTISGAISGLGTIKGDGSIIINGTGSFGTINFDQTTPGTTNKLTNLTVNRSGQIITLGNALQVSGVVTPTAGTIATGGNLTLLSAASGDASIAAGSGSYITGNVTVQRYIPAATSGRKYRYLAAPFATGPSISNSWQQQIHITGSAGASTPGTPCPTLSAHGNGFDASTFNNGSMFTFNEATATIGTGSSNASGGTIYNNAWISVANTNSTNLSAGQGYNVFIRGARSQGCGILNATSPASPTDVTLSATGTITTGSFTYTGLTYNAGNGDGWNLVGNPYPSAIDWDAASWTKTNILPTIWVYNPANNNYSTYNTSTGGVSGGSNIIPSGTAFFVRATGSPTLGLTEAAKTSSYPGTLLLKNKPFEFRVTLKNSANVKDEHLIALNRVGASDLFDPITDAEKIHNPNNVNVFSIDAANKKYAINAISKIEDQDERIIPLGTGAANIGNYQLSIAPVDLPYFYYVFLRDHFLKTEMQVASGQTLTHNFQVTSDSASFKNGRFDLFVSNNRPHSTGLNISNEPSFAVNVFPNPSKDEITVNIIGNIKNVKGLNLYNAMGQLIAQIVNPLATSQIDISAYPAGVYFLQVTSEEISVETIKLIKN